MGWEDEPTFCCGECEHAARPPTGVASYTVSPAVFVPDTGPGPILSVIHPMRRDIPLTRGMQVAIGCAESCDIVLDDKFISQRQCELRVTDDGRVYITDLLSTSGTRVNNKRVPGPHRLHERDAIQIGQTILVFPHTWFD